MKKQSKHYICPRCQYTLEHVPKKIEIFTCPQKHGAWVENSQLRQDFMEKLLQKPDRDIAKIQKTLMSPAHPESKLLQRYYRGIEIDVCPKSGGVWLDSDEILPFMRKSRAADHHLVKENGKNAILDLLEVLENLFSKKGATAVMEFIGRWLEAHS